MTQKHFALFVTYTQVAVFDPALQNPFNDWQPQHVAQGFAWRPGSVSFQTLEEGGWLRAEVRMTSEIDISSTAIRAIMVPFSVTSAAKVEVASISDSHGVDIPTGDYALVFETGYLDEERTWGRFTFVVQLAVQPTILRADEALSPPSPLLMEALPA